MKTPFQTFFFVLIVLPSGCGTEPHGGPAGLYMSSDAVNSLVPGRGPVIEGTGGASSDTAFRFRRKPDFGVAEEEGYWLYHYCSATGIAPSSGTEDQFINKIQRSSQTVGGRTYDVLTVRGRYGADWNYFFDVTQFKTRQPRLSDLSSSFCLFPSVKIRVDPWLKFEF